MKKLLILIVTLAVLVGGGWLLLTKVIISPSGISEQLTASLAQATGREVQMDAHDATVQLWPSPQVTFPRFRVSNIEGSSNANFISSGAVTFKLSLSSLMAMQVKASKIIFDGAAVELEVQPSGKKNWYFSNAKAGSAFRTYFQNVPIELKDGVLHYVNAGTGADAELQDLDGELRFAEGGSLIEFKGSTALHGEKAEILARTKGLDLTTEAGTAGGPLQVALKYGDASITTQGEISDSGKSPKYVGELEVDAPHIWAVLGMLRGGGDINTKSDASIPRLSAKGKIVVDAEHMAISDIAMNAGVENSIPSLKGTLNAQYHFGKKPMLDFQPMMEAIDIDHLLSTHDSYFKPSTTLTENKQQHSFDDEKVKVTPWWKVMQNVSGSLKGRLGSAIYRGRSMNNVSFLASMDEGEMTINRASADLPGGSKLAIFGVARAEQAGYFFDGTFDLQGRKLESLVEFFAPEDVTFPDLNLGQFAVKTNIASTPKQLRFSELKARVKDTGTAGAIIFHKGDRLKLESFLRVANIDLDIMGQMLTFFLPESSGIQKQDTGEGAQNLFDVSYINNEYNWLGSVGFDMQSDFVVENFVLLGRKGERAKLRVEMGVGEIALKKVDADYNGSKIKGSARMKVDPGANPYIEINTRMNNFDMVDLFPDVIRERNAEEKEQMFDTPLEFVGLQAYSGRLNAQVGRLSVGEYVFENVTTEGVLKDSELSFEKFNATLWDGNMEARAKLQAGTIPAFSISTVLSNLDLVKFSRVTPLLKYAAGDAALSVKLGTSGATLRSWVQNAEGSVGISGQNVSIQGFGLTTLARVVPVARAVADLVSAKRVAMDTGITRFREMSGQLSVAKGKLEIPRINFKSEEAVGMIAGAVDLLEETMSLMMDFTLLSTVEDKKAPRSQLKVSGSIDNLEKELQTRELEAYIARKAAERTMRLEKH